MRYSQNRRTGYKNFMGHVAWLLVMAFGSAEISAGKKRKSAGELSCSLGEKTAFRHVSKRFSGTSAKELSGPGCRIRRICL